MRRHPGILTSVRQMAIAISSWSDTVTLQNMGYIVLTYSIPEIRPRRAPSPNGQKAPEFMNIGPLLITIIADTFSANVESVELGHAWSTEDIVGAEAPVLRDLLGQFVAPNCTTAPVIRRGKPSMDSDLGHPFMAGLAKVDAELEDIVGDHEILVVQP